MLMILLGLIGEPGHCSRVDHGELDDRLAVRVGLLGVLHDRVELGRNGVGEGRGLLRAVVGNVHVDEHFGLRRIGADLVRQFLLGQLEAQLVDDRAGDAGARGDARVGLHAILAERVSVGQIGSSRSRGCRDKDLDAGLVDLGRGNREPDTER